MAQLLSPGVAIREKDFTTIVPAVATAFGGAVGRFTKGPINTPILISSVSDLVNTFGKPTNTNAADFFTIAEYLKYSNKVWVVRAEPSGVLNSSSSGSGNILVKNLDHYDELISTNNGSLDDGSDVLGEWVAKNPGAIGNSLRVIMVDKGTWSTFKTWADNNATDYPNSVSLAKYFSQPPRTSSFVEARSESGDGARLQAVLSSGSISSVNVLSGGKGYGSAYIEVSGSNQFVSLTPVVNDGVVTSVQLSAAGSGYVNGTVTITSGGGAGGSFDIVTSGGAITGVSNVVGGTGYSTVPFEFSVPGGTGGKVVVTSFDGVITSVTVNNGGSGYGTVTPSLAVFDSGKDDELHVLVIDVDGKVSGVRNNVLEKYEGLSKASNAKDTRGQDNYYKNVINSKSSLIYFANQLKNPGVGDPVLTTGAGVYSWGSTVEDVYARGNKFSTMIPEPVLGSSDFYDKTLAGGSDGSAPNDASIKAAFDLLANTEQYDVNLVMTAAFSTDVIRHVVENVVYQRKDAMAFVSPHKNGLPLTNVTAIQNFKEVELALADQYAQYAVMDTGFKYILDGFNNVYRWVPLNGDIAGVCARVDETNDAWWSPGGFNRGGIKNVIKLAYNPTNAERDVLYPRGINPVVSIPGSGVVLMGDRTMTSKPSAFDRINVRRLFNVLEKAIGIAAKYQLFEFNDSFTRAQFRNMVEPYLRNIQGRRGITDFRVICDDTNNPGDVIDRNEFVADIYVQPARSINFIYLNFIATRTGVDFSTVIGG